MSQLFQRQRPTAIIVQGSPQPRCVTHKACRFATHGELREIDRATAIGVERLVPRGLDGTEAPPEIPLEVHDRDHLALCSLHCGHWILKQQGLRHDLPNQSIQADRVAVPFAVAPHQLSAIFEVALRVRPCHQQMVAANRPCGHERNLTRRPATGRQQRQTLAAVDVKEALRYGTLQADKAGAIDIAKVEMCIVDEGDAIAHAEPYGAHVDLAALMNLVAPRAAILSSDQTIRRCHKRHQFRGRRWVVRARRVARQGCETQRPRRPHVLRQLRHHKWLPVSLLVRRSNANNQPFNGDAGNAAPEHVDPRLVALRHEARGVKAEEVGHSPLEGVVPYIHRQRVDVEPRAILFQVHRRCCGNCRLLLANVERRPLVRVRCGLRYGGWLCGSAAFHRGGKRLRRGRASALPGCGSSPPRRLWSDCRRDKQGGVHLFPGSTDAPPSYHCEFLHSVWHRPAVRLSLPPELPHLSVEGGRRSLLPPCPSYLAPSPSRPPLQGGQCCLA
mmetsp:Transcript_71841/g.181269  ORF Transcript_71841/g.181269 Transcript_71841/m.181269 type:complete len:502 (+) Transcript_71841:250-1755(+)